jgi:two-component system response regulator HydG
VGTSAKRVLIVDDETNMRTTLADILSDEGYQVDTASDGITAVEMCAQQTYEVILLDVRMPGIDGVETFRRIRRQCEGARIVMMSAFSVDELKRSALDEGAVAFLSKPLDIDSVVSLIQGLRETAILVVAEDKALNVEVQSALKTQGYWVSSTSSPYDALELAEQIHFDIVLIDMKLPTMNGLEFYLALKKVAPNSVAVMLCETEAASEDLAREAVRKTAYTLVHKPLDLDNLQALLARITGQQISNAISKPLIEA